MREPLVYYVMDRARPVLLLLLLLLGGALLTACSTGAGLLGGGNWQASGLKNQHIRVLTVNANNPDIIYAGDEQGQVFVSSDAGQKWTEHSAGLPSPTSIHALLFERTSKKLYAATDKGIYTSDDSVQQWTALATSPGKYTALEYDSEAVSHLYTASDQGIMISTDSGVSWHAASNGLPQGLVVNSITLDGNHQLWIATSHGVYRADDKGTNWQALNNGLPDGIICYSVQPASLVSGDKNLVYLGTNRGFFVSHNAGARWEQGQSGLTAVNVHRILLDFRRSDATTLYAATDIGPLHSTDNGQSWGAVAPGWPRQMTAYDLTLGASGYERLFAAMNDIYLYPGSGGSGGGFSFDRVLPLLLVAFFFFLLFQLSRRGRKRNLGTLAPKKPGAQAAKEKDTAATPPSDAQP